MVSSGSVLAFGYCLFFAAILGFAVFWGRKRSKDMRNQIAELSTRFESACPICGHEEVTWGALHGGFIPLGRVSWNVKPVFACRCDNCGHLMMFTEPPAQIKRKRQPDEPLNI